MAKEAQCFTTRQYDSICKDHFEKIHERLKSIDDTIRGNGTSGLNARMAMVEEHIKTVKSNTTRIKATLYGVAVMAIGMMLPWFVKLLVYLIPIVQKI